MVLTRLIQICFYLLVNTCIGGKFLISFTQLIYKRNKSCQEKELKYSKRIADKLHYKK
jgi:hypothetical protein